MDGGGINRSERWLAELCHFAEFVGPIISCLAERGTVGSLELIAEVPPDDLLDTLPKAGFLSAIAAWCALVSVLSWRVRWSVMRGARDSGRSYMLTEELYLNQ